MPHDKRTAVTAITKNAFVVKIDGSNSPNRKPSRFDAIRRLCKCATFMPKKRKESISIDQIMQKKKTHKIMHRQRPQSSSASRCTADAALALDSAALSKAAQARPWCSRIGSAATASRADQSKDTTNLLI